MNSCELMIQQLCITDSQLVRLSKKKKDSQLVRISRPTSLTHNYSYFFFFLGGGGRESSIHTYTTAMYNNFYGYSDI